MNSLFKALPLILLCAGALLGQTTGTPVDCTPATITFTSATTSSAISNANTSTPCRSWEVSYDAPATLTVLSIQFETSPDNTTWTAVPNNVCSSSQQPPCVIDGANPSTTTGNQTFSVAAYGRFVRVNVTTYTGSGTLTVRLFGYKGLSARVRNSGSGGGGGSMTIAGTANQISASGVCNDGSGTCTLALTGTQTIKDVKLTFDGGGTALSGSATRCQEVSFAGTITGVFIEADQTGNATIDVQTVAHSSYTGPGSASTITASATPALSSAVKYTDTTLTGWTTALSAGTAVCFVLSSPATITWAAITLKVASN